MTNSKKNSSALAVITLLFFMWGFITSMNDILIPFLKKVFELTRAQSMLVQFSFFIAYFIGSLFYFLFSARIGDPIGKIGYKKSIIIGLLLSALACISFYPAAELKIYGLFLTALFILGLGFTILQIAANPYVARLGSPETASGRLNLSQGFNSLGTTVAPILGGYLVFHYFSKIGSPLLNKLGTPILTEGGAEISKFGVQMPYLIFAGVFILLAILFYFIKLPQIVSGEKATKGAGALRYRHLVLGMFAIFFYVGGEVSVGSVIINFSHELLGLAEMDAKTFLALYWGGAMIGRFLGAISLSSNKNSNKKYLMMLATAFLTFFGIYFILFLENGMKFSQIAPYIIFIVINLLAFLLGKSKAESTLKIFALIIIGLLSITMLTNSYVSLWCLVGIGIFNSIMWSNIFTLAIKDLGEYTGQASSLLVMMVLGGAILPFIQGFFADIFNGYHYSFFVPMISYIYLFYYGWRGYKVKINEEH